MGLFEQKNIRPMLIGADGEPFDSPDYIYELKLDGERCIAYLDPKEGTELRNKRNVKMLPKVPELGDLHKQAKKRCILDGELLILKDGKPNFAEIQRRSLMSNQFKIRLAARQFPATFVAFDCLYLDGEDITIRKLTDRKDALHNTVNEGGRMALSRVVVGRGVDFYRLAEKHDLEGIVAKRKDSIYSPGDVSKDWIRINPYHDGSYIICGYTTDGRNTNLVLAKVKNGALVYKGIAEIANMESMELIKSHKIYKSSLFALPKNISAVWIKPDMVCEVKHEVDVVGNLHIKFIKLRPDKNAWDCTGEF